MAFIPSFFSLCCLSSFYAPPTTCVADKELAEALEAAAKAGQNYDFVNTSNVFDSVSQAHRVRVRL